MCGFVGFADAKPDWDREQTIRGMMETIIHRGPDSGGTFTDDDVTLGFRRLMIIDLTDEGSQPMYNEDKSCVLVFNGEIYNYQELRQELADKGHRFASHTDSEVIIHAYEEYGAGLLQKLRGMFAFAIWDRIDGSLLLARDMFGIKPLYYTQNTTDGAFLFGSEIKSFLPYPAFRKQLNRDALKPYLTFQYSALDETFFQGVYKLKPGHYLRYRKGAVEVNRYAQIGFDEKEQSLSDSVEQIKRALQESVRYHEISDVKVGAFLSGGVDSSYITALSKPANTFSVGFRDFEGIFNETDLAKDLSDILHIENHRTMITADECFGMLPTIQYHMDEPHANLSSVPLYFLAQLASRHVTVVLSGEGADEIFGGYVWYRKSPKLEKYERIPFPIRRAIAKACRVLPRNKATRFLARGGQTIEETFIGQAKIFDENEAVSILKDSYRNGPSVRSITQPIYDQVRGHDDVTKMQYLDLHLWLPNDILLKADKMSMAHSLELRVPFLDKQVMAMASGIPSHLRVNAEDTKYALRAASQEVLPAEWANREKVGFPVPIRHWLKEEKYYGIVKNTFQSAAAEMFFHTDELLKLLEDHYTGKSNRARQIWTVYVFLVWYRRYFEEEVAS